MRVFYVASEAAPLIKVGGLGDVAGSLPIALQALGVDVTLVLPHLQCVDDARWGVKPEREFVVPFAGKDEPITISQTTLPKSQVPVLLLGNPTYIASVGQGTDVNQDQLVELYALFCKAVAELVAQERPDICHYNDWMGSLIPALSQTDPVAKFVLTIHNLSYQRLTSINLSQQLGVSPAVFTYEPNGELNFLKQGILGADYINTVSETYAKEIKTPQFGNGLESILADKADRLVGIINGIDYSIWDPETDKNLTQVYSVKDDEAAVLQAKTVNKQSLQQEIGLPYNETLPVFGFIGRIEPHQKGIDLVYEWLHAARAGNYQCIILGTGDKPWEEKLLALSEEFPAQISMNAKFSEELAHLMYGGCDYILMPSKFEPGGLPQMIAQHYGTIPIVHGVGGLKDTVKDGWTGFSFDDYSVTGLKQKVDQAIAIFGKPEYFKIVHEGMKQNYSWEASAKKYVDLYNRTLKS